ncbi:transglycosylase domain-containing protein [Metabacillus idriensis]|uniref:transglycosylase domain-containing protein n=1 Tax=Metabacillus idriensis TaxID=324768 RepID=UPI003D291C3C
MGPVLIYLFLISGDEVKNVKAVSTVLDEKLPLKEFPLTQNSFIVDQNGALVSEIITNQENRTYVSFDKIPEAVKTIFIVSEDQKFYEHIGFDPAGMARAVLINAKSESIEQGGSTITQQLARNVFLSHEKTYNRKLSELLYSYHIERTFSKEEILEGYLNAVYFHNGVYGVQMASNYYFSKPIDKLTLAQIAFISAIPNNPSLYDPVKNFDHTKKRQLLLLKNLLDGEYITLEQYNSASAEKIRLNLQHRTDRFPDYVTYVHDELKRLIAENEGFKKRASAADKEGKAAIDEELNTRVHEVVKKGVIIHTALDPTMQANAADAFKNHLSDSSVQGASVVIDHHTHQIKALYGGRDYQKFNFNRAYQAYRQPGSAIKPLLDYVPYIDVKNASASSVISAKPFCKKDYCPKNYDEKTYGNVTLETAFKKSYNTPAVRMLDEVGIAKGYSYLTPFGFQAVTDADYVLPSAIGGFTNGFSPLELTQAYSAFGNDGVFYKSHAIVQITDLQGNSLYQWKEEPLRVWKSTTNNEMRKLLSAVTSSGTGTKANHSAVYIGGKTGTTNHYKDLWFVGLTDRYTAGVWIGKDKSGSIENLSKSAPQQLIWRDITKNR